MRYREGWRILVDGENPPVRAMFRRSECCETLKAQLDTGQTGQHVKFNLTLEGVNWVATQVCLI